MRRSGGRPRSGRSGSRSLAAGLAALLVAATVAVPAAASPRVTLDVTTTTPVIGVDDTVTATATVSGPAAVASQRIAFEIYRETAPGSDVFSGPIAGSQVVDTPRAGAQPRAVSITYAAPSEQTRDVVVACVAPSARVGPETAQTNCRVGDGRTVRPVPRTFQGTSPLVGTTPNATSTVEPEVPTAEVVSASPSTLRAGDTVTLTGEVSVAGQCEFVLSGAEAIATGLEDCGPGSYQQTVQLDTPGSYDVVLRFVAPNGNETLSDVATGAVSVVAVPQLSITAPDEPVEAGSSLTLPISISAESGICNVSARPAGTSGRGVVLASFACNASTTSTPTVTAPATGEYELVLQFTSSTFNDTFTAVSDGLLVVVDPAPAGSIDITFFFGTGGPDPFALTSVAVVEPNVAGIAVRHVYVEDDVVLGSATSVSNDAGQAFDQSTGLPAWSNPTVIVCTDVTDVAPSTDACVEGTDVAARDTRLLNP